MTTTRAPREPAFADRPSVPRSAPTGSDWSACRQYVLELLTRGAPLGMMLDRIAREAERLAPECRCTVLLPTQADMRAWSEHPSLCSAPILDGTGDVIGSVALSAAGRSGGLPPYDPARARWRYAVAEGAATVAALAMGRGVPVEAHADVHVEARDDEHDDEHDDDARDDLLDVSSSAPSTAPSTAPVVAAPIVLPAVAAGLDAPTRQAVQLDAMSRLAAGIAHDLNNLLAAVRTSADLVVDQLPDGPARDDADDILLAVDRAAALTRQLLAFSRTQTLETRLVDVAALTERVGARLREVISDRVTIHIDTSTRGASKRPTVRADVQQLEQLLMYLALNARDAMPDGGTLTLEVRELPIAALPAIVPLRPELIAAGRAVLLTVGDTGIGMDEATLQRAFEPFFTTKQATAGTGRGAGLGLPMVYGIAEQSGGRVALTSELDHGTAVYVALPWAAPGHATPSAGAKAIAPPPARAPSSPPRGATAHAFVSPPPDRAAAPTVMSGSITPPQGVPFVERRAEPRPEPRARILLVEDEHAVRELVRRVLARAGYTIMEAMDGGDALSLWRRQAIDAPVIDAVITDMIMPERSGRELVRALRVDRPTLPVLFMSGYLEGGLVDEDTGPHTAFIEKPFTMQRLLEAVESLLAG